MSNPTPTCIWAIPVSYKSLISNLSAYQSQKTLIDEFADWNAGNPKKTHLPQEILDKISGYLLAPRFKEQKRLWNKLEKCAEKECEDDDHISSRRRKKMALGRIYTFYSDNGIGPPPRSELEDQVYSEIEIMVCPS